MFKITPNRLTAVRILIAVVSPILLIGYRSFLIDCVLFVAFTLACVTDWWDGHLARTRLMVTPLGKIADPIADKLLIGGLMISFSFHRLYSYEWVALILMRELAVTTARLVHLKQGKVIPAEWAGKLKVGFQVGSVYATLVFLILFDCGLFWEPEPIFLFVFQSIHYLGIFLATVVTIISGINFFHRLNEA